mmetsp:Transcript_3438/g.13895  ORF Transcript_3438/g.13895 Transcript_3438/m.13895 type:complete len:273 (+) Transcript_3438:726-1544(+)
MEHRNVTPFSRTAKRSTCAPASPRRSSSASSPSPPLAPSTSPRSPGGTAKGLGGEPATSSGLLPSLPTYASSDFRYADVIGVPPSPSGRLPSHEPARPASLAAFSLSDCRSNAPPSRSALWFTAPPSPRQTRTQSVSSGHTVARAAASVAADGGASAPSSPTSSSTGSPVSGCKNSVFDTRVCASPTRYSRGRFSLRRSAASLVFASTISPLSSQRSFQGARSAPHCSGSRWRSHSSTPAPALRASATDAAQPAGLSTASTCASSCTTIGQP